MQNSFRITILEFDFHFTTVDVYVCWSLYVHLWTSIEICLHFFCVTSTYVFLFELSYSYAAVLIPVYIFLISSSLFLLVILHWSSVCWRLAFSKVSVDRPNSRRLTGKLFTIFLRAAAHVFLILKFRQFFVAVQFVGLSVNLYFIRLSWIVVGVRDNFIFQNKVRYQRFSPIDRWFIW